MYDGPERRQVKYCNAHIKLCEDVAIIKTTVINLDKRINGSIDTVEKHIENSRPRNVAIAAVFVSVFIFLFNLALTFGENKRQIVTNTRRLDIIEKHDNP